MKITFPAEWSVQDAVMLTWPHSETDWVDILPLVEKTYLTIAKEVLTEQALLIVVHNEQLKTHVQALLQSENIISKNVHFVVTKTNDTWARDHGPICIYKNEQLVALNFVFNGWGNKFESELDNQINESVFKHTLNHRAASESINLVLEGGGIESDGNGTLLTTSECLLNPNRNPSLSKVQLEASLSKILGIKHFLWLDSGYLAGDDTDSHIDTLARFAPNDSIVYVKCNDANDVHFNALSEMETQLKTFTTQSGNAYTLYPLPWPSAKYNEDGDRLPATYANYLIMNNKVLVPTYQDSQDENALSVLAKAYPEHQVVGIDCTSLIHQFGSLHCITMQLPRGFLRS